MRTVHAAAGGGAAAAAVAEGAVAADVDVKTSWSAHDRTSCFVVSPFPINIYI